MPTRFPAVLAALVLAAAGVFADQPKPAVRASYSPAPDTETPIACAVRVLTVRDDLLDRAGIDVKAAGALSDAQLQALLETVQGDRLSGVLQCPKVTLLDGQEAVVRATQQEYFVTALEATLVKGTVVMVPKHTPVETGTTLTLCARASADRKSAALRVYYSDARVVTPVEMVPVTSQITPVFEGGSRGKPIPFTQYLQAPRVETLTIEKPEMVIPSGGHMIIPGPTRTQEVRQEFGPPVLSKVPYLSRMFKSVGVGRTTVQTYLIVSPLVLEVPVEPVPQR
jgi:hypothetical protein